MLILTQKEIKRELKQLAIELDKDLYENVNLYSVLCKTKPILKRFMKQGNSFTIYSVCTIKKDVYKLIREHNELEQDKT